MNYPNGNGTPDNPSNGRSTSNLIVATPSSEQNGKVPPAPQNQVIPEFDKAVVLRQSPFWSRAIIWTIAGVTLFAVVWAFFADIDEAIPAQGKLEPQGAVKEVQVPVGGLVESLEVEEGDMVQQGDVLMKFDQTSPTAELASLRANQESLEQENEFYRSQLNGSDSASTNADLNIPAELRTLTTNRAGLQEENQLYRGIIAQRGSDPSLSVEQQERLRASISTIESSTAERQLEVQQLNQQLSQVRLQLANTRDILAVNTNILGGLELLNEEGAIPRIQYLQQQQEVNTARTNVNRLVEEQKRIEFSIQQAGKQLQNTVSSSQEDLLTKIEANEQRIAEIDSQLSRVIRQNEQRLNEINSQLAQAELTLDYQELRAPITGTVFDIQVSNNSVVNSSETVLKLVPGEGLIAQVFITNRDIGFVERGMEVDVRVDSFPYSEFGDVKGKVIRIGSDALPPDELFNYYRYPVEIKLDKQSLDIRGKQINLQSGMSVNVNIKVRDRKVIDIFTNLFRDKTDSLQNVR